ncbi:hypothetical protein F4804DRAFT_319598 [Jackrogersella minutella]|nr:hypothetical protein F4804DRAFT_319598 [Jackrogersella minutella]
MLIGACDSLVLSAACHLYSSYIPSLQEESNRNDNFGDNHEDTGQTNEQILLRELSMKKLRWGVTPLPLALATVSGADRKTKHLSFCGEEEFLYGPIDGRLYA